SIHCDSQRRALPDPGLAHGKNNSHFLGGGADRALLEARSADFSEFPRSADAGALARWDRVVPLLRAIPRRVVRALGRRKSRWPLDPSGWLPAPRLGPLRNAAESSAWLDDGEHRAPMRCLGTCVSRRSTGSETGADESGCGIPLAGTWQRRLERG